ncbi:hypothetical protein D3C85_1390780 [compost metagenome]
MVEPNVDVLVMSGCEVAAGLLSPCNWVWPKLELELVTVLVLELVPPRLSTAEVCSGMKPILHKMKQVAVQVAHDFIFVHLPLPNLLVYVTIVNRMS